MVGMLYDETEGITFLKDYNRLLEVFDDPRPVRHRAGKTIVTNYLRGVGVGTAPLRLAAEADLETTDRVLVLSLGRKGFSWERDGEDLLRRYRPEWFEARTTADLDPLQRPAGRSVQTTAPLTSLP